MADGGAHLGEVLGVSREEGEIVVAIGPHWGDVVARVGALLATLGLRSGTLPEEHLALVHVVGWQLRVDLRLDLVEEGLLQIALQTGRAG